MRRKILNRRIDRVEQATAGLDRRATRRRGSSSPPRFPGIAEFVSDPAYLGGLALFPLQMLMLKIIFLATENDLTAFDLEWIRRWGDGFTLRRDGDAAFYEGEEGTAPDLLSRMAHCRGSGRSWLREVILVLGRRSGKGYLGAICAAYILWRYICDGDPHAALRRGQGNPALVAGLRRDQEPGPGHAVAGDRRSPKGGAVLHALPR